MTAAPSSRPNILVMVAHDIGRHLGCYGVPETGSDHLDHLAAEGVCFTRFSSTAPQCSPARASLFTGRYPHSNGMLGICSPVFGFDLHAGERHLASLLSEAGYATALAVIQHETLRPDDLPFEARLAPHAPGPDVAASAAAYIQRRAGGDATDKRPFYLQVGFGEAHRPWRGCEPYAARGVHVPPWLADDPVARQDLARFQGAIRVLDRSAGTILGALEAAGIARQTLVVFVADHGIPYARAKHSLYEPGCAVAALLRWPDGGWHGGRRVDNLLSGVDLLPTVLDAAGVPVPAAVQGRSFAPLLNGAAYEARDAVFTEQGFNAYPDVSRAVHTASHALIANFTPGRAFYDSSQLWHPPARVPFIADQPRTQHPSLELYDLSADPLQARNLAGDTAQAETLHELSGCLLRQMQETGDPLLSGLPAPPIYYRTLGLLGADAP